MIYEVTRDSNRIDRTRSEDGSQNEHRRSFRERRYTICLDK